MMELTKERIELFIKSPLDNGLTRGEQMEMARQLLAGLEQEPVAWTNQRSLDVRDKITAFTSKDSAEEFGEKSKWEDIVPLYAAPQLPQPAVPDEWRMMCGEWRDETVSIHDASGLIVSGISPNAAGIIIEAHNTCRAAMLQGAEPVSQPYTLRDGWVAVPVEPTHAMINAWLSEVANWHGHVAGYKAMLAEAPKRRIA